MAPLSPSTPNFQSFILSAIPFRRKSSSATTNTTVSSSAANSPASDAPTFLSGHTSTLSCARCHAELALTSQIISKGFTGRHGRAYLVSPRPTASTYTTLSAIEPHAPGTDLPNTHTHKAVPRHLVTGMHTVCDVSCSVCGSVLGWKYVGAEDEAQRYKVGKFILEGRRTLVGSMWEGAETTKLPPDHLDDAQDFADQLGLGADDDSILFDSQDEDECEDLFSGIWSPELAKKRRRRRAMRD